MNRRWLTLVAVLGTAHVAAADWSPTQEYAAEALREDLRVLRQIFTDVHPGLHRYRSPAEIEALFERADAAIRPAMTERQFLGLLSPVVTGIRCMHTVLLGSRALNRYEDTDALVFPLRVKIIDERLWVRDACGTAAVPAAAEIFAVDELGAAELIGLLIEHGSADGENRSRKLRSLENNFASRLWRYRPAAEAFDVTLALPDGRQRAVRLAAQPAAAVRDCLAARDHDPARPFELEFLDDPAIAVLTLPTFVPDSTNIARFMKRSFKSIAQRDVDALVLDLRGNPGGFDDLGVTLMRYVATEPFRYFRSLDTTLDDLAFLDYVEGANRGFFRRLFAGPAVLRFLDRRHPGLRVRKPMRDAFNGPVFALVDGGTASTAAEFCAVAQHAGRVELVGEECGGGYLGDNSGQISIVTLPNSRVRVSVPLTRYVLEVDDTGNRGGARPDHAVLPDIVDLVNGRDTVMEFLLGVIREQAGR